MPQTPKKSAGWRQAAQARAGEAAKGAARAALAAWARWKDWRPVRLAKQLIPDPAKRLAKRVLVGAMGGGEGEAADPADRDYLAYAQMIEFAARQPVKHATGPSPVPAQHRGGGAAPPAIRSGGPQATPRGTGGGEEEPEALSTAPLRGSARGERRAGADQDLGQRGLDPNARQVVVYLPAVKWGYLFQRPQQLLRALAKRGHVCIFCTPDPVADQVEGFREVEPNLFLCSDVRLCFGLERPILWFNWTLMRRYVPFFREPRVVYEFIDELCVFRLHSPAMERDHLELARSADVVVASAARLLDAVRAERPDAVFAPNAVAPEDFADAGAVPEDLKPVLARGSPVVGYYGALARWFDCDLFNRTAAAASDLSFVLIGPDYDGTARKIERRPNVFLLGEKPYPELSRYARRFDVATIPFQINDITRSTSPVKLFEYMAAGAPIVTTAMDECARYPSVTIARSAEEYLARLREAAPRRRDAEYRALLARDLAGNTWDDRVTAILRALHAQPGRAPEALRGEPASSR